MANCNNYFKEFDGKIQLTKTRKDNLKKSRKELRNRVRKWFKENKPDEIQPKFEGQGSFSMNTIINPIPRKEIVNGEEVTILSYDIDDGIYFIGNEDKDERVSPITYHKWIYKAVEGHTSRDPIDKNTCIRTLFSDGRNIDQPIYYKQGETPELAHKRDGWIDSDPKAFTDWFEERVDDNSQLRRLVRYGKAWCDNRRYLNNSKPMPSGLVITILFTENIVLRKDRDDIALKETLLNIHRNLKNNFECRRPTSPKGENLLKDYTHQEYFLNCLSKFIDDATEALKEKNFMASTLLWRKHLSERFPLGENKVEESNNTRGLVSLIPPYTKPYAE